MNNSGEDKNAEDKNSKMMQLQRLEKQSEKGDEYNGASYYCSHNDDNKDEHSGGRFACSSVITKSNDDDGRDNPSGDEFLPALTYDVLHDGKNKDIDSKQMLEVNSMETENNSVIEDEEYHSNEDCMDDKENCSETSEEYDEHLEKLYSHPSYTKDFFQALEGMKQSAFLTDLTLITKSGSTFHVHSLVLAAVSSLIVQLLNERDEKKQKEIILHLDLGGSDLGISAVLEFAYTGTITGLNTESLGQIQTAALLLRVPRVLELCKEKERQKENGEEKMKEGGDRTFDEKQLNVSLKSIRQLWEDRVGCDVEVEAEGRIFRAHKIILSASSDYFHAMFLSGMRESQQSAVSLLMMGAHELEAILHCCYSGEIVLDWGCVFQLTSTTLQFQFQPTLSLCLGFLKEEMDAYRCLDVASFAEAYAMCDLQEIADDFVLRHFEDVASTLKFQDLSVEKLKKYLHSDCLCVASELPVFKAVISWIEANPSERVKEARELMGTILFSLMTFTEFKEVKVITSWPQVSARGLYESLLEEFCSSTCNAQAKFRTYCPKEALVLVGGERITENLDKRSPCREIWFSNSFRNHVGIMKRIEWRMLADLPEKPRFSHKVGAIKGKLYVVGGRHYYGKNDTMKCTYRYDPIQNTWKRLANMCETRASFALVVLDKKIYAIGGERDSEVIIESVEMYCPIKDSWSLVHPLDQPVSDHAASVWNGEIFISGGFDRRYQCLATMLLYHPNKGTTYLVDMSQRRAQHCMEALHDYLYIAGGISDADGQFFDQLACEIYDPSNGFCCAIMSLPVPHVSAASAVLEGKIYILGGYWHEDFSDTKLVHRYDSKIQRWESLCGTPGPNTYIAACVLPIPPYLRQ
ncbi:kelch-like protein 33 [Trichomycterus rosablanca]|uniref:kelch-like protein 33 n=1 Tax=Trichomycterus rosablanca TaxID=2290929 RepID=UPI002F35EADA